jgi:hypothetical protein
MAQFTSALSVFHFGMYKSMHRLMRKVFDLLTIYLMAVQFTVHGLQKLTVPSRI